MNNIEKYYDNTTDAMPNYTIKKFIELNVKPSNAVELGCWSINCSMSRFKIYCT